MTGLVLANRPEIYPFLHTVLDLEDLYDIVESILIDTHNKRLLEKKQEQDMQRANSY